MDLTGNAEEEEDNDNEDGHDAQPQPPNPAARQSQMHLVRLRVDMCPVAKPSVRFGPGRGGGGRVNGYYRMYKDNEVTRKMDELREMCKVAATAQGVSIIPRNQPVMIKAWFFLKRPEEDFISRRRVAGRLREEALLDASTVVAIKPDVDNCAKFLLDSLTGALFVDDAQVVSLQMFKLRDTEGLCNGRMQIECSLWTETVESVLPNW